MAGLILVIAAAVLLLRRPEAPLSSSPDLAAIAAPPLRVGGLPNIVLILADDLGYGALGAYGGALAPTPNIDALARDGMRYTHAYAAASVCAPSRAGLLTGRYPQRYGFEFNPGVQFSALERRRGLDPAALTVAETLRAAGYSTALVGKWHLGLAPDQSPASQGFDTSFALLHGATTFVGARRRGDAADDRWRFMVGGTARTRTPILRDGVAVTVTDHLTDRLTREAQAFVLWSRDRPFFLHVAYTEPHAPLEAAAHYLDAFPHLSGKARIYAAKIAALDAGVGALMETLRASGLANNTVVVFASDNGCPHNMAFCEAGAVANYKATLFEGGVRTPLIVRDPAGPRGVVVDAPVSLMDLAPTFARLASAQGAGWDGIDLAMAGRVNAEGADRAIFWRSGRAAAVRQGALKLVSYPAHTPASRTAAGGDDASPADGVRQLLGLDARDREPAVAPVYSPDTSAYARTTLLFDVVADPGEMVDLSSSRPADVARLEGLLAAWSAAMATPRWDVRAPARLDHYRWTLDSR